MFPGPEAEGAAELSPGFQPWEPTTPKRRALKGRYPFSVMFQSSSSSFFIRFGWLAQAKCPAIAFSIQPSCILANRLYPKWRTTTTRRMEHDAALRAWSLESDFSAKPGKYQRNICTEGHKDHKDEKEIPPLGAMRALVPTRG